jgi:beta-glucosidase/6-phospho-beta-glucosidase/beta-galactosidase
MEYWYYKQDIVRLAAMGLPWLAFSISWTRIIPFGVAGSPVNLEAIQHYRDKIDFCNQNGIKIIVTLCHYDRPAFVSADTDEFVDGAIPVTPP